MTSGPSDWYFPRATFPGAPDIGAASGWHDEKTDGKNLESHRWHLACPSALGDGTCALPICTGKLVGLTAPLTFNPFHLDLYPSHADAFSIGPQIAGEKGCAVHTQGKQGSDPVTAPSHHTLSASLSLDSDSRDSGPANPRGRQPTIHHRWGATELLYQAVTQNSQNPIVDKHLMLVGDVFPKCLWGHAMRPGQPASRYG